MSPMGGLEIATQALNDFVINAQNIEDNALMLEAVAKIDTLSDLRRLSHLTDLAVRLMQAASRGIQVNLDAEDFTDSVRLGTE